MNVYQTFCILNLKISVEWLVVVVTPARLLPTITLLVRVTTNTLLGKILYPSKRAVKVVKLLEIPMDGCILVFVFTKVNQNVQF
jgi:hypothetical protein